MAQTLPAKRFLDVMKALCWAYRDELPKRQHGGTPIGGTWLSSAGPTAADRDGESAEPRYPAALGEPHPDARAIETAVKGLGAQSGQGFGPDDPAGLMHGIDHMDVDHVQAGMEAVATMAAIVAVHARAATRPRWTREQPRPYPDFPERGGNGKPPVMINETFVEAVDRKGVYYKPAPKVVAPGAITYRRPVPSPAIRKGIYREGAYCPLVYRPRPAAIVAERAEYAAWRMGLELIHTALEGRLASIATLPPAAAWRPWAGEADAHGNPPHLFAALRDSPYRRERLTREQQAARRRTDARRRQPADREAEVRPLTRPPSQRKRMID